MGRRSRKRAHEGEASAETRAERDAARRRRASEARSAKPISAARPRRGRPSIEDRPAALWGSFPLTELIVLAGIALMTWGFLAGAGAQGNARIAAGLAVASLAGLELAVREHVTGFRSHTTLLSGALAIMAIVGLGLGAGVEVLGVLLIAGISVFAASVFGLRELFRRRSGGVSFR